MKLQAKNVVVCVVVAIVLVLGVVGFSQRSQFDRDLQAGQALQEARARMLAQIRANTDQDTATASCFQIVGNANPVGLGSSFLLNRCTGETWWYDNGWDHDEGEWTREKTWYSVNKQ